MVVVNNELKIKNIFRVLMFFSFLIFFLIIINGRSVNAQNSSYPTDADKYISVSKEGNGINLDAPASVIKIKFSGDTRYMKVFIGDGQFHTGIDAGNPPVSGRANDTIFKVCGSNSDGSKNGNSCTGAFDAASFGPLYQINVQDGTAPQGFANNLSVPIDAEGFRNIYVTAQMNVSGLNGFRVGAIGYSNTNFTTETSYTRVGFGATQGNGYNMSLVRLPLDGNITVSPSFNLNFSIPCAAPDRFDLKWFDADRPPSTTPQDPNIRFRIRNLTTGQEFSSAQLAFISGQNEDAFLGGNNVPKSTTLISNQFPNLPFRIQKGDKFAWIWEQVRGNNGIQFALPYAEADADIECKFPPTASFTPDCKNITVSSSDGNFAGGPNWVLESNGIAIPGGSGRGNAVFAVPNTFYDGFTRSITLLYYDVNSTGGNIGNGIRTPAQSLTCTPFTFTPKGGTTLYGDGEIDNESPNSAQFTNVGIQGVPVTVRGVSVTRSYTKSGTLLPAQPSPATVSSLNVTANSGYTFTPNPDERPITDLSVGNQVCVNVTVSPSTGVVDASGNIVPGSTSTAPARKFCDTVVNKPYVSFFGGDVNTCKQINTFYKPSTKVGSGVQYIAQANSSVNQFTSAFGIGSSPKVLTFANVGTSEYGGNFNGACNTRDYFTKPPATAELGTSINPSALTSGSKLYNAPAGGSIELTEGSIPNGQRTALYINGDVRITGNIGYQNDEWQTLADIPSLHVYVKGNIYIQSGVTNLTGFFVAQRDGTNKGIIYTCANGTSRMPIADILNGCSTQLKVRGAFSSYKTFFDRSKGSLRAGSPIERYEANSAAETFFLGPEMYFVSPGSVSTGGTTPTGGYQYQTVLPPLL
jgi:hypothetical protein